MATSEPDGRSPLVAARLLTPPSHVPAAAGHGVGALRDGTGLVAAAAARRMRRPAEREHGPRAWTDAAFAPPATRILVVESDMSIAQRLTQHLQRSGFCVGVATSCPQAVESVERRWPDLVVLDLLPGPASIATFSALRADLEVPLVLLSSCGDEAERVYWLDLGADDFVPHPVSPVEVAARVRSVLRRVRQRPSGAHRSLRVGPVVADEETHRCFAFGRSVTLTALEFKLLLYFLRHAGQVISRDTLLQEVWGFSVGATATVTVHVRRLREKIEPDPSRPTLIETVWGVGYRFQPQIA